MQVEENKKYGKLTAIEIVDKHPNGGNMWRCLCECGQYKNILATRLLLGRTKSCGCIRKGLKKNITQKRKKKLNKYDLNGEFGIGYTSKNEPFYFDLEDFDKIKMHTWRYGTLNYVIATERKDENNTTIRQHMLIMNSNGSKDVDHINHITYDNRKHNLRLCERYQNRMNSITNTNITSGVKGVYWISTRNVWVADITFKGKRIYLGSYHDVKKAIEARKDAEKFYQRDFAFKENHI